MDKKDKLIMEIKSIMEEESFDLTLSQKTLDNIIQHRNKLLKEKISEFLNKEIEIPLAPAIIGFAALLAITLIPGDLFKSQNIRIIDMGGSHVIIRESYEVSKK
ncbi:MAG: hypothetical protein GX818_08410 [Tissierellia bacterium]|nr:hypothetical protein [Tissierellia bacterium]